VINAVELEGLEKLDVNDSGVNTESTKNDDGTYTFTLGDVTFSNVPIIERGGKQYFDLSKDLNGSALYYDVENGMGWNKTSGVKYSIDNDIFDPPYDTGYDCESINCSGLVFRQERHIGLAETKRLLKSKATPITTNTILSEGDVVVTLQEFEYAFGYIDDDGNWIQQTQWSGPDFHIVSAPVGPEGNSSLPNVITTNGKRPIYTGRWLNQALVKDGDGLGDNNRTDKPLRFPNGRLYIARFRITETKYKMN
jgi:hypothetical protein